MENRDWVTVPAPEGQLYESARWLSDAGLFQWVDILAGTVHRWAPGDTDVATRSLELEFATVAIPLDADRSIVASRDSLHEYNWANDVLTTVGRWEFAPDVRFNDGGLSPAGEVYIGTMSMERRTDGGTLFRLVDGRLEAVIHHVGISNGIGWGSPDRAFYIDSLVPRVGLLDLRDSPAALSTYIELAATDEPDGLVVTPDGDVLIANWDNAQIIHLDACGTRRPDIEVPARRPTSVAIGGPDLDLLIVTTASADSSEAAGQRDGLVLVSTWPDRA